MFAKNISIRSYKLSVSNVPVYVSKRLKELILPFTINFTFLFFKLAKQDRKSYLFRNDAKHIKLLEKIHYLIGF